MLDVLLLLLRVRGKGEVLGVEIKQVLELALFLTGWLVAHLGFILLVTLVIGEHVLLSYCVSYRFPHVLQGGVARSSILNDWVVIKILNLLVVLFLVLSLFLVVEFIVEIFQFVLILVDKFLVDSFLLEEILLLILVGFFLVFLLIQVCLSLVLQVVLRPWRFLEALGIGFLQTFY